MIVKGTHDYKQPVTYTVGLLDFSHDNFMETCDNVSTLMKKTQLSGSKRCHKFP